MGAFGSCLGIGRPVKPSTNSRLLSSNLNGAVSIDANPFGPNAPVGRAAMARSGPTNSRNAFMSNGASGSKLGCPLPKLMRQSSSLSTSQQQQQLPPYNHQSPSQTVPKLVDIDDNPPFDKPTSHNSHLICNRKQISSNNHNPNGSHHMIINSQESMLMQEIRMDPASVKVLIALFDFEPRTQEDLGFNKGEHLETVPAMMRSEWWYVRSKSTKKEGYVPSNYVAELKSLGAEPWYFGKVGRADAEMRLKVPENKDGAFIIRDSDTSPGQYSLSLKHGQEVKHYRIRLFETGGFYINSKTVFSTIHDLVSHYTKAADGLWINLREPCVSRFDRPVIASLTHDTCDDWEIDRKKLTLMHELGRGQFGQVYEGLHNNTTRVAIKTLRAGSMDPQDFLAEAQIMKKMRHDNLVQLYAVCTKEEPVFIVTELMSKGALISYLQTDEGKNLSLKEYIQMATQIASGMSYIEREKYVHRDLAARNILVGDRNVCKIADFGLARFIKETEYEARAGARFPIKWTAPEAANFSKFTIKSDVWSFGIVLYEIITKGGTPYPDMSNAEVLTRIDKGYRMPQPPNCEAKYYGIMVECWNKEPNKRPTFETLHWKLSDYFTQDEQYKPLELSDSRIRSDQLFLRPTK